MLACVWRRVERHSPCLQVVLPVAQTADGPVGLGLIGPRGADEALLDFAVVAMAAIQAGRKQ